MTRVAALTAIPVALALAASPAAALEENAGGGDVEGTVAFASPSQSVPPLGKPCAATSWSFSGGSTVAAIIDSNGSEFAGALTITAAGGAPCATIDHEVGAVTALDARGVDVLLNSRVSCTLLAGTGTYVRAAGHVLLDATASCQVNAWPAALVNFVASGEFTPTQGDGITTAVSAARFDGSFSTVPG
jgi:hypothetical protein